MKRKDIKLEVTAGRSKLVRDNIAKTFFFGGGNTLAEFRMGSCSNYNVYIVDNEEIKMHDIVSFCHYGNETIILPVYKLEDTRHYGIYAYGLRRVDGRKEIITCRVDECKRVIKTNHPHARKGMEMSDSELLDVITALNPKPEPLPKATLYLIERDYRSVAYYDFLNFIVAAQNEDELLDVVIGQETNEATIDSWLRADITILGTSVDNETAIIDGKINYAL